MAMAVQVAAARSRRHMRGSSLPASGGSAAVPLRQRGVVRDLVRLPERVDLGRFSKADGAWQIDWKRAHEDALRVLATIDFSQRDLVMWIPGTDATGVHHDFAIGAEYAWRGHDVSVTSLQYEASWQLRRSLPTGLATMKLVMEGIRQILAQRGDAAQHRLLLAGLSQGAWIIGETIADPTYGPMITRAILVGHPWLAAHQYAHGEDPRVRVIDHVDDQISMPVKGSAATGLDAMIAVRTGQMMKGANLLKVVKAIAANPIHGWLLLQTQMREIEWLRPLLRNPHDYNADMPRMAEYLRTGVLTTTSEELDDAERARKAASR